MLFVASLVLEEGSQPRLTLITIKNRHIILPTIASQLAEERSLLDDRDSDLLNPQLR